MKKRYRYIDGTKFEDGAYFKILQKLTWRFYFRFIKGSKGWFTPCTKCQEMLDILYKENRLDFNNVIKSMLHNKESIEPFIYGVICEECDTKITKMIVEAEEIIFGNKDYEPLVEVSRLWLDNDDEVDEVTKEEYEKERSYKYL